MAQTLFKMEPSLYALDWNAARFIWAKMIGITDRALNEQYRNSTTFTYRKVLLYNSDFFNRSKVQLLSMFVQS